MCRVNSDVAEVGSYIPGVPQEHLLSGRWLDALTGAAMAWRRRQIHGLLGERIVSRWTLGQRPKEMVAAPRRKRNISSGINRGLSTLRHSKGTDLGQRRHGCPGREWPRAG